jgi:GTPase
VLVRAGSGGQGASTYQKNKARSGSNSNSKMKGRPNGPPDGGNGGRGGDVVVVVDPAFNTLAGLSSSSSSWPKSFRAEHGADGEGQFRHGRRGKSVHIRVPPGTLVQEETITVDAVSGQEMVARVDLGTLSAGAEFGRQRHSLAVLYESRGVFRPGFACTNGELLLHPSIRQLTRHGRTCC